MLKIKTGLLSLIFCTSILFAQQKIENLNWLEGTWTSEKWGGIVEEYWSAPNGNSIIGMFRLINEGKVQFTEHWILSEYDGNLALRLRHFNPDFTGWEEKDEYLEFPFQKMGDDFIQFKGLRYELVSSTEIKVTLDMKRGENIEQEIFNLKKK
ncbi:MAG: hypothetical protein C4543_05675 [Ignavibacteriales bacterium]|jgi:hypothetical protein|nr:DUF6265 family protein [Melioribacteraceae bacterium]RJP60038.1 MAG: hypothetical protein C4543_05675 [Ignavibacteriales bacterium]